MLEMEFSADHKSRFIKINYGGKESAREGLMRGKTTAPARDGAREKESPRSTRAYRYKVVIYEAATLRITSVCPARSRSPRAALVLIVKFCVTNMIARRGSFDRGSFRRPPTAGIPPTRFIAQSTPPAPPPPIKTIARGRAAVVNVILLGARGRGIDLSAAPRSRSPR